MIFFGFIFASLVAVLIWMEWRQGRRWKKTVNAIKILDRRQKSMDENQEGLNSVDGRLGGVTERVAQLESELRKMKEAAQRRNPLDAIVREQKRIGC